MPSTLPGVKNAQKNTFGGFNSATIYSGAVAPSLLACPGASGASAGPDVLLFSGAGRLDTILMHPAAGSGLLLQVIFYDAGVVSSGGPFAGSGHKIVGYLPHTINFVSGAPPISGNTNNIALGNLGGDPKQVSQPFQSGLCVALKSGQPGFTVVWTPEIGNM